MDLNNNHLYIGKKDYLREWAPSNDDQDSGLKEKELTTKVKNLIKNYLQLDNVNFFFGTGSSIHLGATSIQNIPMLLERDIKELGDEEIKIDFDKYITSLQKETREKLSLEENKMDKDDRGWELIFDGTYIRNYLQDSQTENNSIEKHYGEILLPLEQLLNYLISIRYQKELENDTESSERIQKLINALKKSLFNICDISESKTRPQDLERIESKEMLEEFKANKYIFHEKFLKSLLQRPINLQRANIFTSNYDLAFEYAFDNLGVKYIDGFSGFHHRYFKPETFNYDIYYPGTTTEGKVQRIEKVVRYVKLHGSISWVHNKEHSANNIYGIEEMPLDLIRYKDKEDKDFSIGDLIIYPSAVKKSYTLDLPYSELFRHFSACISRPQSVLFTIGYSFCDEHFNDIIYQALSNPSFTLIIVDYNGTIGSKEIKRLRDLNDPRIIILEGDYYGDFLTFADTLMPDFMDYSSDKKVADTLKNLLTKEN